MNKISRGAPGAPLQRRCRLSEELAEQIRENAQGPKRAKSDSVEMEQHGLSDQIAADRYLASRQAAQRQGLGVRVTKLVPPGAA